MVKGFLNAKNHLIFPHEWFIIWSKQMHNTSSNKLSYMSKFWRSELAPLNWCQYRYCDTERDFYHSVWLIRRKCGARAGKCSLYRYWFSSSKFSFSNATRWKKYAHNLYLIFSLCVLNYWLRCILEYEKP